MEKFGEQAHTGAVGVAVVASDGLFGPTVDDVFRLAITVIGIANVGLLVFGMLFVRHYARLLLDVEQTSREARNRLRERVEAQMGVLTRDIASISADIDALRVRQEQREPEERAAPQQRSQ